MVINMKQKISVLLLLAMLASLVSCGSELDVTPTTTAGEETTEAETTPTSPIASYLPDTNLDGFELRVACARANNGKDFWSDEANGEVVNDAVYDSVRAVNEKFNAKLTPVFYDTNPTEVLTYALPIIQAGDDVFDLLQGHDGMMWNTSLEGYFTDIRSLKYQDFSQPWYPKNANDAYEINGKQYVFSSYLSYSSLSMSKVIFMNKDLINDFGLELPYDDICAGKWTLDKMFSMAKSVYTDLDGDEKTSEGDMVGFLAYNKLYGFQAAFVECYVEGSDGKISIDYDKERFVDVVTRMNDLLTSESTYVTGNEPDPKIFIDGRALFFYSGLSTMESEEMRSMKHDFGVIPVPKYDEKQEDYITPAFDTQLAISKTSKELDKVSLLIEAYSSAGYNIVRDAYFKTALQDKYTRDEDSVEMLNIISNTLKVDLAYLNTDAGINGLGRAFMYCFSNPDKGVISYLDSIASAEQVKVDKINEFFSE